MCLQSGVEEFKLGDVRIWLPKENIREVWRKTKKIVDIYLEMGAEMEERERDGRGLQRGRGDEKLVVAEVDHAEGRK